MRLFHYAVCLMAAAGEPVGGGIMEAPPLVPPSPPGPPPAAPAQAAPPAAPEPPPQDTGEKIVHLPSSALGRIRKEERQRGHDEALAAREEEAKLLGFKSHEEMREAAEAKRKLDLNPPPPPDASKGASEADRQTIKELRELVQASQERVTSQTGRVVQLEGRVRELEGELSQVEATNKLRTQAVMAGVQDVDYAMTLLNRKLQGLGEQEREAFDVAAFFGGTLKQAAPYLFAAQSVPATTGPGGPEPAQAGPAQVTSASVSEAAKDARTLPRQEYEALLKKHGLVTPGNGLSY